MRTCVRQHARMYSGSKRNLERARQRLQLRRTLMDSVSKLYRIYRRATDGADGATGTGLNGSIRPTGLVDILLRMGVKDEDFADLGAGDGKPVLAALLAGARSAIGYELPVNAGHEHVFNAVCKLQRVQELCDKNGQEVSFYLQDIDKLKRLRSGTAVIYAFWVGMLLATQQRILKLAAQCASVRAIAVFRDEKWKSSSAVLAALSDAACIVRLWPTASPSADLSLRGLCCRCTSLRADGSSTRNRSQCS